MLCGSGHIAIHAFVSGEWAITRGNSGVLDPASRGEIQYRSCDHGTAGKDLDEAMKLAYAEGLRIREKEDPQRITQPHIYNDDGSKNGKQLTLL